MIPLGIPIRARVLKITAGTATLGVYSDGTWRRISARIKGIELREKEWIRGILTKEAQGHFVFKEIERDGS